MGVASKIWQYMRVGAIALSIGLSQHGSGARAAGGGACGGAAYRALDFTLGNWTVAGADGKPVGVSRIASALNGCVVSENWSTGPHRGQNLDAYNIEDHRWHRFFVDTDGRVHVFEGAATTTQIRYAGPSTESNGATVLNRLIIRKDGANKLVQEWQKSKDAGKTWTTAFRGLYSRTKATPSAAEHR